MPLGYDVDSRKLVVNETEADLVRHTYRRYRELGPVVELADELKGNASGTSRRLRSLQPSLLLGLVFDGEGRAMTPRHASKPGRRYRYYITRPDQLEDTAAWRVSAYHLENLVYDRLSILLTDQQFLCDLAADESTDAIQRLLAKADLAAATLRSGPAREKASLLSAILTRVDLKEDGIDLTIDKTRLGTALELETIAEAADAPMVLTLAALSCLAPDIVTAIVEGRQPTSLTARTLQDIDLPLAWTDQRALLGFA